MKTINNYQDLKKYIIDLYMDGVLIAFFRPKATVFFATVFPTFLIAGPNYYEHFFILLLTYISLDFLTLAIYSGIDRAIASKLKNNLSLVNYISAGALVIIAIVIAIKV
jgi:threonine/homoserine/homoserine lactone efflux protein